MGVLGLVPRALAGTLGRTQVPEVPAGVSKKFNPFWLVMIDFYWGRQSTRDHLEVYYTQEQLGRRLEDLCAKERGTDIVKFTRSVDEKMTGVQIGALPFTPIQTGTRHLKSMYRKSL